MFLIYINDLDKAAYDITTLKKFADDTKPGQTVGTVEGQKILQQALINLENWAKKWGMGI